MVDTPLNRGQAGLELSFFEYAELWFAVSVCVCVCVWD